MREDDDEPAKKFYGDNSKWFQLVAADLASRKLSFEKAQSLAARRIIMEETEFSDLCAAHTHWWLLRKTASTD